MSTAISNEWGNWEVVIGLEIHAQLATRSKIFSGASTAYGAEPNTQTSVVDIALPGVLPVLNKEAVHMAVKFGMAINAEVADRSVFDRKNYFYPDLPKGYQISQFDLPIVGVGHINIELENGETKTIGVTRAHLEEDAGKSLHDENCITCHSKMYPGKGNGIYTRENRRIETLDGLYMQVNRCKDSLGFKWPEDQIEDLVTYLNKTYYKFEE